ncbi:hypothetical protein RHMOL_Rhmol13G0298600 [Rhododendron molle]|uniref:Uncharacterized protein n=1 Tax=Rhododendron molle TaxID=49168 RepID=A0ACC0LDC0_RHOML|nr:hypothetical protein RHMOL_Rhmol13G0298600 [Rhododendron molle]
MEIKQAKEGTKEVPGLVEVRVCDTDAVWKLLKHGSRARSTNANQLSSPSHWTSRMTQMLQSSLGEFLACFCYFLVELISHQVKLTATFQGEIAKLLMIVQINTSATDLRETLSCLKFANLVRGIEHGPARKRMHIFELFKYKQQLAICCLNHFWFLVRLCLGCLLQKQQSHGGEMGLTLQDQKKNALMQSNIVVAVIDSGICLQLESFSDEGIRPLEEAEFPLSNDITFKRTNKVVAANCYYLDDKTINIDKAKTITDYSGHGTGCASVIAGRIVDHVGYGLIKKVAEAVTHGAHILSMSISEPEKEKVLGKRAVSSSAARSERTGPLFMSSNIAQSTLLALLQNVLACVASGNEGVRNFATWQLNVGSYVSPWVIQTKVLLGHGYGNLQGKILVCKSSEMVPFRLTEEKEFSEMADCALDAGVLGMIVIIDGDEIKSSTFPLPVACVWDMDHMGIKNLKDYMRSNR